MIKFQAMLPVQIRPSERFPISWYTYTHPIYTISSFTHLGFKSLPAPQVLTKELAGFQAMLSLRC